MMMNDGLSKEDILALQAPLPLGDHEAREKGTNKDKTKKQFLIYINQEGVIPLLNSIDPNWSWDVQNIHFEPHYVSVTGRLTIKGIARDGVGGNSPNGTSSPVDEDTVKGAETDALKRAALRFGVGLYLRGAPTFWIDANLPPWEGSAEALKQFSGWYGKEFKQVAKPSPFPPAGTPQQPAPAVPNGAVLTPLTPASTAAKDGSHEQRATPEALYQLTGAYFNARAHFDNFWTKHQETLDNLTVDEARMYVEQAHWNYDKEAVAKLRLIANEQYGISAGSELLDALSAATGHSVKKWRDWDGGNFTLAQGALLAWYAGFTPAHVREIGKEKQIADGVIFAAEGICAVYAREHAVQGETANG